MVLVPATDEPMFLTQLADYTTGYDRRQLPEFAISKFEVTNREYKEFVSAGGYDNPAYWEGLHFTEDGRDLDWPEARSRFVDRTGRPGPADWELSTYPPGQGGNAGGRNQLVRGRRIRALSTPCVTDDPPLGARRVRTVGGPIRDGADDRRGQPLSR